MKYRSLSLTGFEAVQVDLSGFDHIKAHRWERDKPQWFRDMMKSGDIQVVVNRNDMFIVLKNENATFRVLQGQYIIRNRNGLVFWMPADLFQESFVPENFKYGMTQKQQAVYDYIIHCERTPTVREIMRALGYKSTSPVHRHLHSLKERGYIKMIPRAARGIKVL